MTHASRLAQLTAAAAVAAAGFTTIGAAHAGQPAIRIVELPRVTVVGHRLDPAPRLVAAPAAASQATSTPAAAQTRVVELPRVVIVAKRLQPSTTLIAERNLRASGV